MRTMASRRRAPARAADPQAAESAGSGGFGAAAFGRGAGFARAGSAWRLSAAGSGLRCGAPGSVGELGAGAACSEPAAGGGGRLGGSRLPSLSSSSSASFTSGANLVDARAHQGGEVLVALLALREQAEHRLLVLAERHGPESLCQRNQGRSREPPVKVRGDGRRPPRAPLPLRCAGRHRVARRRPRSRPRPASRCATSCASRSASCTAASCPPWSRASARGRRPSPCSTTG